MKKNLKVSILALSVLLVMAIATTIASYSHADEATDATPLAAGDTPEIVDVERLTNVDYIIKNANDTTENVDHSYHIVEIYSDVASGFSGMMTAGFADYVLNGNKSESVDLTISGDKITYDAFKASDVKDTDTDKLQTIAKADFIYISNKGNKFEKSNDIGEELYNLLHTYAIGDYKPLVIDSPNQSTTPGPGGGITPGSTTIKIKDVVDTQYAPNGAYYHTYAWDGNEAQNFLTRASGSSYIGVNSRTAQSAWTQLYLPDDTLTGDDVNDKSKYTKAGSAGTSGGKMAKLLVVSQSGTGSGTLATNLLAGSTATSTEFVRFGADGTAEKFSDATVFDVQGTTFQSVAYSTRYSYRPDFLDVDYMSFADFKTASVDGYDFIILESDIADLDMDYATYNRYVGLMKAGQHILYSSTLGEAQSGSSDGGDDTGSGESAEGTQTKYKELYYMVATSDGIAQYPNIMPTSTDIMEMIATSNSASVCKILADLINSSSFRGIGGPTASSNKYTVLEIQPCYPIDLTISDARRTAISKYNYYRLGVDMAPSGTTKEQLGIESDDSGKTIVTDKTPEYYAWELSEAKIAQALGMEYDMVKVDHMSIEEFAANKTAILGTYDMVYIGANGSAFDNFAGDKMLYTPDDGNIVGVNANRYDFPNIDGNGGNAKITGATFGGRDLSQTNYDELVKYVNAGMPVVFSKDIETKSDLISTKSKMSNFINYCNEQSTVKKTTGFDQNAIVKYTEGGLGETKTGYVWVFDDTNAKSLLQAYEAGAKRPTLTVTTRPPQYNLYDESTKLNYTALKFNFESNLDTMTPRPEPKMYIDKDGNGAFEGDEEITATADKHGCSFTKNTDGSYTLEVGKLDGLIYWKMSIANGKSEASATGAASINPKNPKKVNVLQILPDKVGSVDSFGQMGATSLIFCTECQRTYHRLNNNPVTHEFDFTTYNNMYRNGFDDRLLDADGNLKQRVGVSLDHAPWYEERDVSYYIGKHEHKFGIVKYGGSEIYWDQQKKNHDVDDWDWNFADELKNYDFHLDVWTTREYEAKNKEVYDRCEAMVNDYIAQGMTAEEARVKAYEAAVSARDLADTALLEAQNAELAPEAKLRDVLIAMVANAGGTGTELGSRFQRLLDNENYYEYYSSFNDSRSYTKAIEADKRYTGSAYPEGFYYYYEPWAKADAARIAAEAAVMEAAYDVAYFKNEGNWLTDSYSSIILGPAENFNGDDIKNDVAGLTEAQQADAVLRKYVDKDGQVLMFHETFSRYSDWGPTNLTDAVMGKAGIKSYSATQFQRYSLGYANGKITGGSSEFAMMNYSPYLYSYVKWNESALWNYDANNTDQNRGSNRAEMNNRCAVNTYPFTLSDKLNITSTHPVAYALDLDPRTVTPLYTIATSGWTYRNGAAYDNNAIQTVYPATPRDADDNYFIYRSGNVFYCGAGHTKVTGPMKNNNDERRLYINIICSSVDVPKKVGAINVFDYGTRKDTEANGHDEVVPINDGKDGYWYEIPEDAEYPQFTFQAIVPEGRITKVDLYYKLDPTFLTSTDANAMALNKDTDVYVEGGIAKLPLIKTYSAADIKSGDYVDVGKDVQGILNEALYLKDAYFQPYGGLHTYIIIAVTTDTGDVSYQKIKVIRAPHLFDLT